MINLLRMEFAKVFLLPRRWPMTLLLCGAMLLTVMRWIPQSMEPFGLLLPWFAAFTYLLVDDERRSGYSVHLSTLPRIKVYGICAKFIMIAVTVATVTLVAWALYGIVWGRWPWRIGLVVCFCDVLIMCGIMGVTLLFRHRILSLMVTVLWSSGLVDIALHRMPGTGEWLHWLIPTLPIRRCLSDAKHFVPVSIWPWVGYLAAVSFVLLLLGIFVSGRRTVSQEEL